MSAPICTARSLPHVGEHRVRTCGVTATHLVGAEQLPRCRRHAQVARSRGDLVLRIAGDRRTLTGEAHPGGRSR